MRNLQGFEDVVNATPFEREVLRAIVDRYRGRFFVLYGVETVWVQNTGGRLAGSHSTNSELAPSLWLSLPFVQIQFGGPVRIIEFGPAFMSRRESSAPVYIDLSEPDLLDRLDGAVAGLCTFKEG